MTFRRHSPHARERWIGLVAAVGLLAVLAVGAALASLPASFFIVNDQQGANDVPGQVDLTRMGRDDTDPTTYKLLWSWDSIDQWTGTGQTGDACALFDSDADGNINAVVCGQITNPNADPTVVSQTTASPFVFKCSDKKNDRCTNPSPVTYTASQVQAGQIDTLTHDGNLITDTDPFDANAANGPGTSYPDDSTLEVSILKSFLTSTAGGTASLVNVCSYPSAGNGGNNNPFDCIVTPGTGFLVISKDAGGNTTQSFTFGVSPTPPSPQASSYSLVGGQSTDPAITMLLSNSVAVTETLPATGWALSSASCTIEGVAGSTGSLSGTTVSGIHINSGKVTTCTFTNAPVQPKLELIKNVTNNNGGTSLATAWTFTASGTGGFTNEALSAISAGSYSSRASTGEKTVSAGVEYTLSESGPSGYSASTWSCDGGYGTLTGGKITLALGDDVTCQITNNDVAPQLTVIKHVVNNNGGTKVASDFTMSVTGTNVSSASFAGAESPGTTVTLDAGSYSVSETGPAGYTESDSADCSGSIAIGQTKTCTITNNDVAPQLTVIKHVVNNNGGSAVASDFTMSVTASNASDDSFAGAESPGTTITLDAGSYSVSESGPSGYTESDSTDCSGSIAIGQTKTCTITNDDQGATLIVIKHVINDNGGTNVAADFTMTVTGSSPSPSSFAGAESPGTSVSINAGSYSVGESGPSSPSASYSASYSADCSGSISLGQTKTCTVTNDDVKASPGIGTTMKWTLNDTVTLSGFRTGGTGGTASFSLYKGDATCSDASKLVFSETGVAVNNTTGVASTTTGYTTSDSGMYYWFVTYSGNNYNNGNDGTGTCGNEVTTLP